MRVLLDLFDEIELGCVVWDDRICCDEQDLYRKCQNLEEHVFLSVGGVGVFTPNIYYNINNINHQ